jgi:hypothetical protein
MDNGSGAGEIRRLSLTIASSRANPAAEVME